MADKEYLCWEDQKYPAMAQRIDTSAGRIDYDYTELGIGFQANAIYPDDPLGVVCQLDHAMKLKSNIRPHIHWIQNAAQFPNWLLKYRMYDNGESVPGAWTLAVISSSSFVWGAGNLLQLSHFPEINGSSLTGLSAFIDFKLYRDTTNASALFAGADPYAGIALVKEFDVHVQKDSRGSREELTK